jgi:hypothetical protein
MLSSVGFCVCFVCFVCVELCVCVYVYVYVCLYMCVYVCVTLCKCACVKALTSLHAQSWNKALRFDTIRHLNDPIQRVL